MVVAKKRAGRKRDPAFETRRRDQIAQLQKKRALETQDVLVQHFDAVWKGPRNKKRRLEAAESFRRFCEIYGAAAFPLAWSKYHLRAIAKIESSVLEGGFFAFAMPRGKGKTTLCHWAVLWAVLCGHCDYVQFVGATSAAARRRLANLKTTLRFNDLLAEDFPEIIWPIRHLGGESRGAVGQKFAGKSTNIEWKQEQIVTATLDFDAIPAELGGKKLSKRQKTAFRKRYSLYSLGFGAIIECISIEGELRGRNFEKQDGRTIRPKLILPDDPQTRESAKSLGQVNERYKKIAGDLSYGKGPGERLGVLVPCTIIYEDDLADKLIKTPEFRGEVSKMVDRFPPDFIDDPDKSPARKLWDQYREKFIVDLETGADSANEFYAENRAEMDDGFEVAWIECFDEDEQSAIQHAMNLFYRDEASFWAEAQNSPGSAVAEQKSRQLVAADIIAKSNKLGRGVVPLEADYITAYVDISERVLWWCVIAIQKKDFQSWVIDFGTAPDQKTPYYTLPTLRKTLAKKYPGELFADALEAELDILTGRLCGNSWKREDGAEIHLNGLGIDSGWGDYTNEVYQYCRRSKFAPILYAMKGVGVTARTKPLVDPEAKQKKFTRESVLGQWRQTRTKLRTILSQYNTNFWKSKAFQFWGKNYGGLSIFRAEPHTLQVFADQVSAESFEREKIERTGREVDVFSCQPGVDNHFGDCLVGCLVLGHILGAVLPQSARVKKVLQSKGGSKPARAKSDKKSRRYNVRF